ncbi:MAG: outer membrane beta-barrel protein [Crocinitomix sp.]|nr:outer membrane beta-barrel protein [Crocinitomix sp.]
MKNLLKVASLLLFLAPALSVNAQISIGPKAGINFATFGGNDAASDNKKSLFCYQFGAVTQLRINETFVIQPEFLYYQKGVKYEYELFGEDLYYKQILNYFEIPILAKFTFFAQESAQVYGAIGPSFGIGLDGILKTNDFEEDIDFENDGLIKLDLSLSVGGGIQIQFGPGKCFIDVRYLLGLNGVYDTANSDIKNRSVGVGLGYLFPLGDFNP